MGDVHPPAGPSKPQQVPPSLLWPCREGPQVRVPPGKGLLTQIQGTQIAWARARSGAGGHPLPTHPGGPRAGSL